MSASFSPCLKSMIQKRISDRQTVDGQANGKSSTHWWLSSLIIIIENNSSKISNRIFGFQVYTNKTKRKDTITGSKQRKSSVMFL